MKDIFIHSDGTLGNIDSQRPEGLPGLTRGGLQLQFSRHRGRGKTT
jgi:hypothetical protein